MNSTQFDAILMAQLGRVRTILGSKAEEYASDKDRLHNFKQAAHLMGVSPRQALGGFMAKHTVSIFDMIASPEDFTLEKWDEKITDHVNYLILLRALVEEDANLKQDEVNAILRGVTIVPDSKGPDRK